MKKLSLLLLLLVLLSALCVTAASSETLDYYFKARFSTSPKFYTGPGTEYLRAGNGKAQYGGHGEARVYGYEGSWLLLGYQTGAGNYRIGYFQSSYTSKMTVLSDNYDLRRLNFEYRRATITGDCNITDDPVLKYEPFARLQAGTQCTYLASYNNSSWAYIEVAVPGQNCNARGFVPMNMVSFSNSSPVVPDSGSGVSSGFYTAGTWATVSAQMTAYSGPGAYYTSTGTYYMQNQALYCLAKHYDYTSRTWWVLCRIFDGNGAQYVWVRSSCFYNADWLLSRLAQD